MKRLNLLKKQLIKNKSSKETNDSKDKINKILSTNNNSEEDFIVIVSMSRTPFTNSKKGKFVNYPPELLIKSVIQNLFNKSFIASKDSIIQVGNNADLNLNGNVDSSSNINLQKLNNLFEYFEFNISSCLLTLSGINSLNVAMSLIDKNLYNKSIISSSSGNFNTNLVNITKICQSLQHNNNMHILVGAESASLRGNFELIDVKMNFIELMKSKSASNHLIPHGVKAEIINSKHNIKKDDIANYSYNSHNKYKNFIENNNEVDLQFNNVSIVKKEIKSGKTNELIETVGKTYNEISLQKIIEEKPCFFSGKTYTKNSVSRICDGAVGIALCKYSIAKTNGLNVLCKIKSYSFGYDLNKEEFGQIQAIRNLLIKEKLNLDDIDVFEINESFCGLPILISKILGISEEKINIYGGEIAIGDVLGGSDIRLINSCANILINKNKKFGIVISSFNLASGVAILLENIKNY